MKKSKRLLYILVLILSLLTNITVMAGEVRLEDDYYNYINYDWLNGPGRSADSQFEVLGKISEDRLIEDLERMMAAGQPDEGHEYLSEALDYYELYVDVDMRNNQGAEPIQALFQKIEAIDSIQALSDQYAELALYTNVPVWISMGTNMYDSSTNIIYAGAANYILPAKVFYEADNTYGQLMLTTLEDCLEKMLVLMGKDQQEAEVIVADALWMDRYLAEIALEEAEFYEIIFNDEMTSFTEFDSYSKQLNFSGILKDMIGTTPNEIKVVDETYMRQLDQLLANENLDKVKHWITIQTALTYYDFLSEEISNVMQPMNEVYSGSTDQEEDLQGDALIQVKGGFSTELNYYYGQTYFDESNREEITTMIMGMIDEYQARIQELDWMEDSTKASAIKKLEAMDVMVGYDKDVMLPDNMQILSKFEGGTLFDAAAEIREAQVKDNYEIYYETPEETRAKENLIISYEPNAYYVFTDNTMIINAALLEEPFYSSDFSTSQKYGWIGVCIGHELSHAFDQIGATRDEFGNVNNWWTEADYAEFEKRSQEMIELFDGRQVQGATVSGELTVSENTADAGGISVALSMLKKQEGYNLEEFFTTWAIAWANVKTDEELLIIVETDAHSPGMLRTNVQLSNCDDFYETYDIQPTDGMYIAPEERVTIW